MSHAEPLVDCKTWKRLYNLCLTSTRQKQRRHTALLHIVAGTEPHKNKIKVCAEVVQKGVRLSLADTIALCSDPNFKDNAGVISLFMFTGAPAGAQLGYGADGKGKQVGKRAHRPHAALGICLHQGVPFRGHLWHRVADPPHEPWSFWETWCGCWCI